MYDLTTRKAAVSTGGDDTTKPLKVIVLFKPEKASERCGTLIYADIYLQLMKNCFPSTLYVFGSVGAFLLFEKICFTHKLKVQI
jgi:hypothetical protein